MGLCTGGEGSPGESRDKIGEGVSLVRLPVMAGLDVADRGELKSSALLPHVAEDWAEAKSQKLLVSRNRGLRGGVASCTESPFKSKTKKRNGDEAKVCGTTGGRPTENIFSLMVAP